MELAPILINPDPINTVLITVAGALVSLSVALCFMFVKFYIRSSDKRIEVLEANFKDDISEMRKDIAAAKDCSRASHDKHTEHLKDFHAKAVE